LGPGDRDDEERPPPVGSPQEGTARLRQELERELRIGEFTVVFDDMNDSPWNYFVQSVGQFASDTAKEINRLEAAERDTEFDSPEITTTMVKKAFRKQLYAFSESVKATPIPKLVYAVRVSAIMLTAATGVVGSYLHSTWQAVTFTAVCCAAIANNIIVIFGRAS